MIPKEVRLYGKLYASGWAFDEVKADSDTHLIMVDEGMILLIPPPKPPCTHEFKTFVTSPGKGFEYAICFDCNQKLKPDNWVEYRP